VGRPRWPAVVALVLAGLAVAHGAYLVLFGFHACSVAANDPGEPPNEKTCKHFVHPVGVLIVALLAMATAGIALRQAWLAWAGSLVALAIAVVWGFSLGMLIYPGLLVLAATAVWAWGRRRHPAPPAAPTP
jgi:hypothetical protein